MRMRLRACLVRVGFVILAGTLGEWEVAWAQSQEKPAENTKSNQDRVEPKKPTRDSGWVITDDGVALLAVRRAPAIVVAPAETRTAAPAAAKVVSTPEEEAAKRKAEIAALEKQAVDMQKRITLLMRLFVDDEQAFLKDPGDTTGDPGVRERRKYEQDELLYETAQLARVKARLEELRAVGSP